MSFEAVVLEICRRRLFLGSCDMDRNFVAASRSNNGRRYGKGVHRHYLKAYNYLHRCLNTTTEQSRVEGHYGMMRKGGMLVYDKLDLTLHYTIDVVRYRTKLWRVT